jgi:hypothetical protein
MTEQTSNPTNTEPTTDDDAVDLTTYRVSGHLPLTFTVPGNSRDGATSAATARIDTLFADLPTAALVPDQHEFGIPDLVEHTAGTGHAESYRVQITVYGYVDVGADDAADAIVVAEEIVTDHLAGHADVTADWMFAVCDDVTPLGGTGIAT